MQDYQDSQEVVRSIKDLKTLANQNWWVGFGSGALVIVGVIVILIAVGLHYNI